MLLSSRYPAFELAIWIAMNALTIGGLQQPVLIPFAALLFGGPYFFFLVAGFSLHTLNLAVSSIAYNNERCFVWKKLSFLVI